MKLVVLLLVVLCFGCTVASSQKPHVILSSDSLAGILEEAYNKKSVPKLKEFFERWNAEIPAISDSELSKLNDTLRNAYEVFTAFYQPENLDSLGGSEWGSKLYDSANAFIVQNSVWIYFDTVKKRENWERDYGAMVDSIMDFRPRVQNTHGKMLVYLTPKYDSILNAYLGNDYVKLGEENIMTPAHAKDESAERKAFLDNMVKIFYGHWGGYWQLNTYPEASAITFDSTMRHATVHFRMVYQGGEATMDKVNGKWKLTSGQLTWIE